MIMVPGEHYNRLFPDSSPEPVHLIKREIFYSFLRPKAKIMPVTAKATIAGITVKGVFVVVGTATRPIATGVLWPPVTVTVWEASV